MAAALEAEGDIWAGYRKNRTDWFPEDLWEKHGPDHKAKNIYFAGCTASYVENDIGMASVRLLDEAGVDFGYLGEVENCCATPMLVAGKWDLFKETMKQNIQAVKDAGGDTVISSCPACDMMWRQVYPIWAEKLGIDYDSLKRIKPDIIWLGVTGFGPQSNEAAYDPILQARSGLMALTGEADGAPQVVGIPLPDMGTSEHAYGLLMKALYRREARGEGACIHLSMFESTVSWLTVPITFTGSLGKTITRRGKT